MQVSNQSEPVAMAGTAHLYEKSCLVRHHRRLKCWKQSQVEVLVPVAVKVQLSPVKKENHNQVYKLLSSLSVFFLCLLGFVEVFANCLASLAFDLLILFNSNCSAFFALFNFLSFNFSSFSF